MADEPGDAYTRALGKVLRTRREGLRLTRKALLATFPAEHAVSFQTFATWELGTRVMPTNRLPVVARALGTTPHELLAEVDQVVSADTTTSADGAACITVNLVKLAAVRTPTFDPVARWALAGVRGGRETARLSMADLDRLAELVSVPARDLAVVFADAAVIPAA